MFFVVSSLKISLNNKVFVLFITKNVFLSKLKFKYTVVDYSIMKLYNRSSSKVQNII